MGTLVEEIFSRKLGRKVKVGELVLANLDYWQDLADDLNSGLIEIEDIRVVRGTACRSRRE